MRPLGNRLVVRRWPETELTESGLWLPSDAREKPQLGDVLAVGPGAGQPIDIVAGEVVVFEKMVSRDFEWVVAGERLLVLPYDTIYCAIRNLLLHNAIAKKEQV